MHITCILCTIIHILIYTHVIYIYILIGKWSLMDCFVMVVFACAFYLRLSLLEGKVTVEVNILAEWGFQAYIIAVLITLLLGHIVMACHRRALQYDMALTDGTAGGGDADERDALIKQPSAPPLIASKPDLLTPSSMDSSLLPPVTAIGKDHNHSHTHHTHQSAQSEVDEALCSHTFSIPTRLIPSHYIKSLNGDHHTHNLPLSVGIHFTPTGKIVLFILLALTTLGLLIGTTVPTFLFTFQGLTGYILGPAGTNQYSLASLGLVYPDAAKGSNRYMITFFQICYYVFGFVMPLLMSILTLFLWFVPMTVSSQKRTLILAEIVNAWSALDVFCVALIAGVLELPLVSLSARM